MTDVLRFKGKEPKYWVYPTHKLQHGNSSRTLVGAVLRALAMRMDGYKDVSIRKR